MAELICTSCGYPAETSFNGVCKHCISSAAPELLAVCLAAQGIMGQVDLRHIPGSMMCLEALEAAIAKAKGGC